MTEDKQKILRILYQLLKIFIAMSIVNCVSIALRPWTSSTREIALECWIPNKYFINFEMIYTIQIIFLAYIIFLIVGFDMLFATLCAHVIIQFQLLNEKIKLVDLKDGIDVKKCIKQHEFLIR